MAVKQENFLVPLEVYLKAGLHIGTKFKTAYMDPFIYKIRPDGLAVLNIQAINRRIELACSLLKHYKPEEILVVGKRENGWKATKLFSQATGIRSYAGKYNPGIMTNPQLEDFLEIKLIIVTDPWPDKDAVRDAVSVGAAVIALCDTNNESNYIDLVVPSNNKGKKSLGLFFYILAREYLKSRELIKDDKDMKISMDEFLAE